MAIFRSLNDLITVISNGSSLIADMFQKHNSVEISYEDALETLHGNERRLCQLISYEIVVKDGDFVELNEIFVRFFNEVLNVNEIINTDLIKTYIEELQENIKLYMEEQKKSTGNISKYADKIRSILRSIKERAQRDMKDLRRNINDVYKQEPNFTAKIIKLKNYDKKCNQLKELIEQTERLLDNQPIFLSNEVSRVCQTVNDVRLGLKETAHSIINLNEQVINYLNRFEYQNRIVKRVRRLKYLIDHYMITESTNMREYMAGERGLWLEKHRQVKTRISLDFIENDDNAVTLLSNARTKFNILVKNKVRCAERISEDYLKTQEETEYAINHQNIINAFLAQSDDLFDFVWNFDFKHSVCEEDRLVLFLRLATQFSDKLSITNLTSNLNKYEYLIIYAK